MTGSYLFGTSFFAKNDKKNYSLPDVKNVNSFFGQFICR